MLRTLSGLKFGRLNGIASYFFFLPPLIRFSAPNDHLLQKAEQRESRREIANLGPWEKGGRRKETLFLPSPDLSPAAQKMGYPSQPIHIQMPLVEREEIKSFQGNKWDCCPFLGHMIGVSS